MPPRPHPPLATWQWENAAHTSKVMLSRAAGVGWPDVGWKQKPEKGGEVSHSPLRVRGRAPASWEAPEAAVLPAGVVCEEGHALLQVQTHSGEVEGLCLPSAWPRALRHSLNGHSQAGCKGGSAG